MGRGNQFLKRSMSHDQIADTPMYVQNQKFCDLEICMQYRGLQLYKVCINDDTGLTLTYLTTRSNLVSYAFEFGKLLQNQLIGKTICSKLPN